MDPSDRAPAAMTAALLRWAARRCCSFTHCGTVRRVKVAIDQVIAVTDVEQVLDTVDAPMRPDRVIAYALIDAAQAGRVVGETDDGGLLVVGDRITDTARAVLNDASISWWDRRGTLHLIGEGVHIHRDDLPGPRHSRAKPDRLAPATFATAVHLLVSYPRRPGVRETARQIDLSPASVSRGFQDLRQRGLIRDADLTAELFWAVAEDWTIDWTDLAVAPTQPDIAATGTHAAISLGAPIIATDRYPIELVTTDPVTLKGAQIRHPAGPSGTVARIGLLPHKVPLHLDPDARKVHGQQMVHPILVALQLGSDPGRGTEAVSQWTPEFAHVW